MPRDDDDRGGESALRQRHAGVGGHGRERRDAGHDLVGDACRLEGERLLAATSEDVGVATLQANDERSPAPVLDEQRIDLLLRRRCVAAGPLAHVKQERPVPGESEHPRIDQPVVDDDVGHREELQRAAR